MGRRTAAVLGLVVCALFLGWQAQQVRQWHRFSSILWALGSSQPEATRQQAADSLRRMGTNALPFLLETLPAKKAPASTTFQRLWRWQKFLKWSRAYEPDQQRLAISGFRVLGQAAEPAIPALLPLLTNSDWRLRATGVQALGSIPSQQAVPALVECLRDETASVRFFAAKALRDIGTEPSKVISVLTEVLKQSERGDPGIPADAAIALAGYGRRAEVAIPDLVRLAAYQDERCRDAAIYALKTIDRQAAIAALEAALKNEQDPTAEVNLREARRQLVPRGRLR